jgi:amino acid transporter
MIWNQLFARKSIDKLNAEMKGDNRLRRVLGPISLTALGVGAIIGAGIFVMTGRAAAIDAGPGIMVSYIVAGLGCLFAALCYCEFAAMAPVAGSAYTYAYATLGELLAWIIGWDLILEYAMACAVVASAWSKYFNEFLRVCSIPPVPDYLMHDPFTGHALFNLPAALIVLLVTVILVIGIRESAGTNAVLVGVKLGVVIFVILVGAFFVKEAGAYWYSVPASDRITTEERLMGEEAKKLVMEGGKLKPEEAQKRIDAIVKSVKELNNAEPRVTGASADKRIEDIRNQIAVLYRETAKLPEAVAEERIGILTQQGLVLERIRRTQIEASQKPDEEAKEMVRKALTTAVANYADRLRRQDKLSQESDAKKEALVGYKTAFLATLTEVVAPKAAVLNREGKLTDEEAKLAVTEAATNYTNFMKDKKLMDESTAQSVVASTEAAFQKAVAKKLEPDAQARELLTKVDEEAPKSDTKRWGILGLLGLNSSLKAIDDTFRSPFLPYGLSGVMLGAAIVFFAYIGFDSISTHSEEAVRPQRDVPIGILASLGICTVLYIGVAAVITGMVRFPDINQDAAIAAAFRNEADQQPEGSWANWLLRASGGLIAIGALAGMTSVLLITFLSQARIFLAMARDKLLPPKIFGVVHPKFKTPHISTMLTGGVIAVVAALTPIAVLEEMVSIGTLMAFVVVCAAVLILRIRQPGLERPFKAPLLWVVAPLGVFVNLAMTLFLPWDTWLRLVVWLALGLVIYFTYSMWRSDVRREMLEGQSTT